MTDQTDYNDDMEWITLAEFDRRRRAIAADWMPDVQVDDEHWDYAMSLVLQHLPTTMDDDGTVYVGVRTAVD